MIKLNSQSKKGVFIKSFISKLLLVISLHWSFVSPALPLLNNLNISGTIYSSETSTLKSENKISDEASLSSKITESDFYYPDTQNGIIGTSEEKPIDNPNDNLFVFSIDDLPQSRDRVFLEYDLYGVTSNDGISKKINNTPAVGGYLIKRNKEWSSQREEIDPGLLIEGDNHLLFGVAEKSNFSYRIRNVRMVIDHNCTFNSKIVLQSNNLLKFENEIYLRGFLRGVDFDNCKLKVGSTFLNLFNNQFEGFIKKPEGENYLNIELFDVNNKLIEKSKLSITSINKADHKFFFKSKPESLLLSNKNQYKSKNIKLYVNNRSASVHLTPLRYNDLASLQTGILNVTKEYDGYNILSSDSSFYKEFSFGIKYDLSKVPEGYSAKDISTLFFDTRSKSWIPVKKDSINIEKSIIYSSTKYGSGDYINGIIQTPESPQTNAFTSTKISDIELANPSSNISIISAPSPSQTGEANLSYPIKIPSGRKGMSPNINLSYNSDKQSGIAGYGWDLGLSSISVNSKWGVPDFDSTNETELYNLDGAQLVYPDDFLPHRHSGDSQSNYSITTQARSGSIKNFTVRNQGSYVKIERIGTNTTNYYWKVTNTDGKINWYGGDENGISENTII